MLLKQQRVDCRKRKKESLLIFVNRSSQRIRSVSGLTRFRVAIPNAEANSSSARRELSCVRCHKVHRAGGEVGPNLTTIGKERDARYLLEAICLPNAKIAKGFETAVIADLDGNIFSGIVKSEDDDNIELIQADGSQKRIALDDIDLRRKGKSSMPADLVKHLSGSRVTGPRGISGEPESGSAGRRRGRIVLSTHPFILAGG